MKMAFIAYLHGFGGAEKQLILLANEMQKRGHEVSIISLCENKVCFKINNEVNNIFIPDEKRGIFLKVNRYKQLKNVLKGLKPDVTINFWFQSAFFTAFMPEKYVGKIIYSERGDPGDKEYSGLMGILRKISFKKIDGFVFQTKVARDYFNEKIRKRSIVVHNPINIKQEQPELPIDRRNAIVTIGRLHEQKDQKFLIEVFKEFLRKHPPYILEIYGEGKLETKLKEFCKQLEIQENVKFMGNKENVHSYVYNAKMFILTSKYEGMPNALLEAMALGIPSISSNYNPKNSVYEFIKNEVNGMVYEEGNKQQLLEGMCKIVENKKLEETLSANSKKIYEENSKEKIYNKWEEYLKKHEEKFG